MSVVKTPEQIEKMRVCGKLLAQCLNMLVEEAVPGTSGQALDTLAETFIRDSGAIPAFKNYGKHKGMPPFPGSLCFSRNHVLVHGTPSEKDIIKDGDIVSIDCGLSIDGWFADAARLFGIGELEEDVERLIAASKDALNAGINACRVGNTLGDICSAIQVSIACSPFYNVFQFCGHAIGQKMHEEPQVPNFGKAGTGIDLEVGMVFCLEPMLLTNNVGLGVLSDKWTIVTLDKSKAAHIEEMIVITEDGPEILTE